MKINNSDDLKDYIIELMKDKNKGTEGNQGNYWITKGEIDKDFKEGDISTRKNTEAFSTDDQYNEIFNENVIPKITVEFDGNVSNYDLSKIDIGETKTSGARAGTQNVNPNVAKFKELKKKIKILNQLERATSNKGEKYRTKQIPILKKEIEEIILELQGD